ncbi:hypothetical protein [Pelagibacterium lentulum]|uniref:Uncharacterized protein n=1 Tax=Pelagibacterium lentulum TaxID=2029865 RepID=A0A916RR44_9HYPH|nr:hypothetical protein [Pelagibacterium lentulum]GGA63951.1 hypothetical protein GCM10011499_37950 [Pelagibacterium lentulum]
MKTISTANQAALAARRLLPRDFLTITARNRETGEPETVGFWSDLGNVTALVFDPDTRTPALRSFYGAGSLISISDIPAVAGITVQRVTILMSQLDELVEQAVRLYDIKQARVEIHTGLLDPDSRKLIDPAEPLFVGFVDQVEIKTPRENEVGGVTISCTSHTQELARTNPETRSHEDQKRRNANDDFYIDAAVCGEWDHFWAGRQQQTQKNKGIFGWGGFLGIF